MRAIPAFVLSTILLAVLLLTGMPLSAQNPDDTWLDRLFDPETFDQTPSNLAWRPGTRELAYWWDDGNGSAMFLEDAATGQAKRFLDLRELGATSTDDLDETVWSADGRQILFVISGKLVHVDAEKGKAKTLDLEGDIVDPKFSPDNTHIAYVRDVELYLYDLDKGVEKRLSHDGQTDVIFNGITDWVYWEEIWGRDSTGFWWHPKGTHIAYYHIDDSDLPVYTLLDTRPLYPKLERQRYPKAGDILPKVEIRVLDLASGETVRLETGNDRDTYLARVHWHPSGDRVAVERLNRDQTKLDLLYCTPDGKSCDVALSEEWATWVNLGDEFTFLPDGGFLWSAERDNWRHLYRYNADAKLVAQLTPDGWSMAALNAVEADAGWFVFTAFSTGPLGASERHIFRGDLNGGPAQRLTEESGWNQALVASSGDWVRTWSDANTPPRKTLRLKDGSERPMTSKRGQIDPSKLAQWEFLTIPGPNGSQLPAQILKPKDFDSARDYPVLIYHYGGPGSQVVENRWRDTRKRYLWHKLMAERGYISFALDNQASRFFGKTGEDKVHRRFGEVELAGQLAGVKYLKKQPWIDAERLGLWGWSGGGSNTLYSLFREPGVWAAGISGAPVTDWRYYDAIWIERYLDHPKDNPKGYDISSPIAHAGALKDPLLLIHGTADNNVHPQNSYNLVQKFIEEEVQFDLALYPNERHSLQTFEVSGQKHLYTKMTEFFDRYLKP